MSSYFFVFCIRKILMAWNKLTGFALWKEEVLFFGYKSSFGQGFLFCTKHILSLILLLYRRWSKENSVFEVNWSVPDLDGNVFILFLLVESGLVCPLAKLGIQIRIWAENLPVLTVKEEKPSRTGHIFQQFSFCIRNQSFLKSYLREF